MENLIAEINYATYTRIQSICDQIHLPLLPLYLPQLIITFLAYQLLHASVGPALSRRLFPKTYPYLVKKDKLDWDIHIVSLTQATLICCLAFPVVLFDDDRNRMSWEERVWGYTEKTATVLAIANGYFYWHLIMMVQYRHVYGWAMVAHGLATASIMTFGFRPAYMTYAPASFLYEFSSIFLNINRYLVKLRMEGTKIQVINGVLLFLAFFISRIIWGTYLTAWFYRDIWATFVATEEQIPVGKDRMPIWLMAMHALSATILQTLNYVWFYKIARLVYKKVVGEKSRKKDTVKRQ